MPTMHEPTIDEKQEALTELEAMIEKRFKENLPFKENAISQRMYQAMLALMAELHEHYGD